MATRATKPHREDQGPGLKASRAIETAHESRLSCVGRFLNKSPHLPAPLRSNKMKNDLTKWPNSDSTGEQEIFEHIAWWLALPDSALDILGARNLVGQLRDDF